MHIIKFSFHDWKQLRRNFLNPSSDCDDLPWALKLKAGEMMTPAREQSVQLM
jgi:hypothetical protein